MTTADIDALQAIATTTSTLHHRRHVHLMQGVSDAAVNTVAELYREFARFDTENGSSFAIDPGEFTFLVAVTIQKDLERLWREWPHADVYAKNDVHERDSRRNMEVAANVAA